jgi:hypothetical protein
MTTYGLYKYGPPNLYGPARPTTTYPGGPAVTLVSNDYLIDPFTATPVDYASIRLTWSAPDATTDTPMTEFRLLSNRYGFPVDQNDGLTLFDTTGSPGVQYLDQNTIPGTMHYYGFYINTGSAWIRAGFAACLMPVNNGSGARLLSWLPEYIVDNDQNELTGGQAAAQALVAPPVPAQNTAVVSPYPFPVQVTLTGGTVTDVLVDGIDLGAATSFWMAASGNVSLQYGTAPAWNWANVPAQNSNQYLAQYLNVAGWALDYIQTQYDYTLASLNDPMTMPLSDLWQLAEQLGVPYQPEIPAYYMRKAVQNWAIVMQQRGSLAGIAEHISLLTGYTADVQVANNIMLENDQSKPQHPRYPAWNASIPYAAGERVTYPTYPKWQDGSVYQYSGGTQTTGIPPVLNGSVTSGWAIVQGPFFYSAVAAITSLPGTAPSGTTTTNAAWALVVDADQAAPAPISEASTSLWANGPANTWEVIYPAAANTQPAANALVEGTGLPNPYNLEYDFTQSSFRVYNRGASAQDSWLRSVIRQTSDFTNTSINGNYAPDPQLVIENGIPVPWANPATSEWNAGTRYPTNSVVTYNGMNFVALRASTGMAPPQPGVPLTQNYDFESGTTGWTMPTIPTGTTAALASSTAEAYHGTHSLQVTYSGTANAYSSAPGLGIYSSFIPVEPLSTISGSAWVWCAAASQSVRLGYHFYDAFGQFVSSAFPGNTTPAATAWTRLTIGPTTVPANATQVQFELEPIGPTATTSAFSYTYYFDLACMYVLATPEWAPLGNDTGIPLMISAQTMQNLLASTGTENFAITPFTEYYDSWGNFIARAFSRTATAGTAGQPSNYVFDGFTTGQNTPLQGRTTDAGSGQWFSQASGFVVDGMGNAFPASPGTRSVSAVPSSCTQALTFTDSPPAGMDSGLIFWWTSGSEYWHAGMTGLWYYNGTTWTEEATYPTAGQFQPGDRIYVITNQSGSSVTMQASAGTLASPGIAVFRNAIEPYNSGTGWGLVATYTPTSGQYPAGSTSSAGIASEAV